MYNFWQKNIRIYFLTEYVYFDESIEEYIF